MIPVLRNLILNGDAHQRLQGLPSASVDTILTSPPYPGLRDYGHPDQIGAQPSVSTWLDELLPVVRELGRVLKPTGTMWLNLGDAYARHPSHGARPKSRLLAPERLVLELADSGWTVRNVIAWHKPNPTPASVRDRFTNAWEPVYLLTRSRDYFFDLDAVRQPHQTSRTKPRDRTVSRQRPGWVGPLAGDQSGLARLHNQGLAGHPLGKNPGDVWTIATTRATKGFHGAFPAALARRILLAGCPERTCLRCGRPWQRARLQRPLGQLAVLGALEPPCDCDEGWQPGLVLDPFMGSGTTAVVAEELERDWLGIELNPAFSDLAEARIVHGRLRHGRDRDFGRAA